MQATGVSLTAAKEVSYVLRAPFRPRPAPAIAPQGHPLPPPARRLRKRLSKDLYAVLKHALHPEPEKRTLDLRALSAWAGPVATAELFPLPLNGEYTIDPTRTIEVEAEG